MTRNLLLTALFITQSALAQEPILTGSGNLQYADGSDGRKVLYSGDSESHIVEKHQKKQPTARNIGGRNPNAIGSESSAIYRCHSGGSVVFVDEDNRGKFASCSRVSAKKNPAAPPANAPAASSPPTADQSALPTESTPSQSASPAPTPAPSYGTFSGSPCSGALLYQGNTYLFSEHEPCPIAHDLFMNRKPLEAQPDYYTAPPSENQ